MEKLILGAAAFFVDWISAVLPWSTMGVAAGFLPMDADAKRVFAGLLGVSDCEPTKPRFGYACAWRHKLTGAVIQWHPLREDMGLNLIMTGQVLAKMSWESAIDRVLSRGGRFTRLDLSIDVKDAEFDIDSLYNDYAAGLCETRATRASRVSSNSGVTMYVGARTSEKFLRVYDKGGEQGGPQGVHWRIELEAKGKAANWIGENILALGPDSARQIIAGYFNAPSHPGWNRVMRSMEPAINIESEKKRPDTERWLMGVVADCMAQMEKINPGFVDRFYDEVIDRL